MIYGDMKLDRVIYCSKVIGVRSGEGYTDTAIRQHAADEWVTER